MSTLLAMLPVYLLGNLHCIGMCGPIVALLGQHRFRYLYLIGRLFSFSLAGLLAGEVGAVLNLVLKAYHIPALTSFLFGGVIVCIGIASVGGWHYPGYAWLGRKLAGFNRHVSLLLLKNQPFPTFLFGFFSVALPCGQTLLVFSACALSGNLWTGLLNGFAFALLTTPSLLFAMGAHQLLGRLKRHYNTIMGGCALMVGVLALLRGFAELDLIPHLVINPAASPYYHIVIY